MENENKKEKKFRINPLQKYIIIFGVVALALILLASFFQYRLNQNAQKYEGIITETENKLLGSTSMIQDLQTKYDKLKEESGAQQAYIDTLEKELVDLKEGTEKRLESTNNLSAASFAYSSKKYQTAREKLAAVDPDLLSETEKQLYDFLDKKL